MHGRRERFTTEAEGPADPRFAGRNNQQKGYAMNKSIRSFAPLAVCALLLPTAVSAQTSFTATGWVNAVVAPGIWATNALDQVICRGIVYTARVQSPEARMAGQVFVICDAAANADGTANMQGPAYLQVGTWDAAGTTFTPSGGVWVLNWRGTMQTDYSFQLSQAGYGVGGSIDGLRLEETVTRGPAANPFDPTVPWLYAGTIKSPPVNTSQVVEDFCQTFPVTVYGSGNCYSSNCQFYAVGNFRSPTHSLLDSFVFGGNAAKLWTVPDGMTFEWRADLVRLDENAANPILARITVGNSAEGLYSFAVGRDCAFLYKYSLAHGFSMFAADPVATQTTNVVLALALTRVQANLVISGRVLEKADTNLVLYHCAFEDTPQADPTLTTAQFQAVTGMSLTDLNPDAVERPFYTSVGTGLGLFQQTDGHQPRPTAVFDNLELRTSEIPPVGIERAVRLSWPASTAINYSLEAAPTVQGPWLPVEDLNMPGMQQRTIPATSPTQFIRLIQAP